MTKQKHSTKDITRKIIVWTLVILSLPLILLGEPAIKVFGLIIAGAMIAWDTIASKAVKPANRKELGTKTVQASVTSVPEPLRPATDTVVLPKKPIIIAIVLIAIIGAYSIGYATGKNTAVRLSKEPSIIAP